jgi:uncharacterized protein YuzB (UPF0349 family)
MMKKPKCMLYCPICRKGYETNIPDIIEFYILSACEKCSNDGQFHLEECIF